jgi:hypothetical protein
VKVDIVGMADEAGGFVGTAPRAARSLPAQSLRDRSILLQ